MHWSQETRVKAAVLIGLAGLVLLSGRLIFLQVWKAPYYKKISEENRIRRVPLHASRGMVYDRQGKALVSNRANFTVGAIPYELKDRTPDLRRVAEILSMDSTWLRKKIENPRYSAYEPVPLMRDANFSVISRIAEQSENLPGLVFQAEPTRKYSDLELARHLLGYVSEVSEEELKKNMAPRISAGSFIGKMGVEREYDQLLRGQDGAEFYEVTATGRIIGKLPDEEGEPATSGLDLVLSIDLNLQSVAESLLSNHPRGCLVALDPQNGEVLCLVSHPDFNANSFASVLSSEEWQSLVENPDRPLLNRVIQSAYPPGSTLKLLVAGAALEQGLITPQTTFHPCNGGFQFGERFFRCWDPEGHGTQNLKGAIQYSCDTYFYQLGLKTGVDVIADYALQCGFGRKLGIDLPQESKGFVPTTKYYNKRFGEKGWTKSAAINLGIGQGEFLATPLQVACFYGALGNGGTLYRPHVLKKVISKKGETLEYKRTEIGHLPFSKTTLDLLQEACLAVVNQEGGTGWQARLPGMEVAGKTGSAENPHGETHAWFVGYAPAQNPKIVVSILIENAGHGGDVAAPIAREIIKAYLQPETELAKTLLSRPETPHE